MIIGVLKNLSEYYDNQLSKQCATITPSTSIDSQFKTALEKFQSGVKTYAPREPRVSFFYHNDQESSVRKPHDPQDRRRVVAYVWVDVTDVMDGVDATKEQHEKKSEDEQKVRKGIVYYGGSVYNPTPTVRGILKRLIEKKITSKDQLISIINTMKNEYSTPHNYNRVGEKQTALGRLSQRPVIFETSATTHQQVREEIKRMMFSRGVYGKRDSVVKTEKKKKD